MSLIYTWVLYLHILSILGFLAAHGIAIGVIYKLRRANQPEEMRTLLSLSRSSVGALHGAVFVVLITGVALGFLGNLWSQLWLWVALVVLFVAWGMMGFLGTRYYDRARRSLGILTFYGPGNKPAEISKANSNPEGAMKLVTSSRPLLLTALGGGGLIFMLWLMIFKPF